MASPCRVLVLNQRDPAHPKAGGAEIHLAEIFGRLAAQGYAVTLLAERFPGSAARERLAGIDVRRLGRLPAYYPRAAWTTLRETQRGRYDVVVECLNKLPFYTPVYSAAPVLAVCHHLFGEVAFQQVAWPLAATVWTAERLIPPIYRRVPFVAISESSREDLIARGLPGERIRVIHCGTRRISLPADSNGPRPQRVAYLGRLEPYKRVDWVLRAMARLRPRFPDAELLVIGRGSARSDLERLAAELDLDVRFTGFVSDAQRDALLASTRVCVCPSLKEGWGLTVIESNAAGAPVVATDVPGLRDSVRHDETGFLVADSDLCGFTDRIAQLLDDDALAQRMSRAARTWASRFDWDDAAAKMAGALEQAQAMPAVATR
jgi:glycosyltransferase involved in cell wall biosynthesis